MSSPSFPENNNEERQDDATAPKKKWAFRFFLVMLAIDTLGSALILSCALPG